MNDPDKPFFLPFLKKEQLTHDCYSFYFARDDINPDFTPGQYFEMKLNINNVDERGDSRVFTIASSPTDKEFYMFTTRIIKSSFKLKLFHLEEGEEIQFSGPWNDLNFEYKDTSTQVFIAGGIGITPYHSIVKYCMDKNITTPLILLVSWKNLEEMVFDDFFRKANNQMHSFSYVPTLTDEDLIPVDWDGEIGRINEEMIQKYVRQMNNSKYFFSGPPAMVNALKKTVLDMGISKEKLITEEFEGY